MRSVYDLACTQEGLQQLMNKKLKGEKATLEEDKEPGLPPQIVNVRVYFYDHDVGKVNLVWGVNEWNAIPEAYWPPNTTLSDKGVLWTEMKKAGYTFSADLQVPSDAKIVYGFSVEEAISRFPATLWIPSSRFNSTVMVQSRHSLPIKLWFWNVIQATRRIRRKVRLNRFEYSTDIQWRKTNYTRFVVLAEARTGSTMLTTLLQSHPKIQMYGELFSPKRIKRMRELRGNSWAPSKEAIEFLNNHVYKPYNKPIRAVGFKIFYQHNKRIWKYVWRYLQESRVQIIHLKRRDLLARYLSSELAKRSQQWRATDNNANNLEYNAPIALNPESCIRDIESMVRQQTHHEDFFADNPMMEIAYENLISDTQAELKRVLEFLGLPEHQLSSYLKRQRTKPKSEVITNFSELRSAFVAGVETGEVGPEWLSFFDE